MSDRQLPDIKAGNDILRGTYPPPRYLVEPIIPDIGLTVVAGPKASGKTQALLSIAAGVGAGGHALGRLVCDQARVLYLQLELSERRVHERLGRMPIDDLPNVDFAHKWRIGSEGAADLRRIIEEASYELIIIDVLQRFWPPDLDSNSYTDAYRVLGELRQIANDTGVMIVVATHTRKMGAEDILDTIIGSVGVVGNADVALIIDRKRGSDTGALVGHGNDIPDVELAMRFDRDTTEWIVTDGNPAEARQTPERREILEFLRKNGPTQLGHIADGVGKAKNNVSQLLSRLKDDGLVVSRQYGVWAIQSKDSSQTPGESSESSESSGDATGEDSPDSPLSPHPRSEQPNQKDDGDFYEHEIF